MEVTNSRFDFAGPEFRLSSLLETNMVEKREEIEEVTDGADKQLKIEKGLLEIEDRWQNATFAFKEWKNRNIQILHFPYVFLYL